MPITREEKMLNSIANGVSSGLSPITREEQYLAYIAGESSYKPEYPITRKEFYLEKIAQGGGGGGGGGGGDEPTDQTALAGAYTAGGKFSNRLYTWDELVERADSGETPLYYDDGYDRYIEAPEYDIVVPDTVTDLGAFYCKDIVFPKTTLKVEGTDAALVGKVYIKATTPPTLGDAAFYECTGEFGEGFGGIIVTIGCGDAYKYATGWCDYDEYITEGEMPI